MIASVCVGEAAGYAAIVADDKAVPVAEGVPTEL